MWILCLALLGVLTYVLSLAASFPARFAAERAPLPAQVTGVSGTLWDGQATLADGYEVRWNLAPGRSLLHLALDVDWRLGGADTSLSGQAALRPDTITLAGVEGRAGWGLVRMAAPNLTVACDGSAALTIARLVVSHQSQGAVGELRSGPAICIDEAREPPLPVEVPALTAVATMEGNASRVVLTGTDDPETLMAEFSVENRVLVATIYPKAAELTKILPTSGPTTLEFPF